MLNNTTHKMDHITLCCSECGASANDITDHKVSAYCRNAMPLETIERVARIMCIQDGNDPDCKCTRHKLAHLRGIAQGAVYLPTESITCLAWELYAHLAEAAIGALRETHVMYTKEARCIPLSPPEGGKVAIKAMRDILSINRDICG